MSDPAWAADEPLTLADGILYIQAAGVTAAVGTASEVGHVTDYEDGHEPQTTERSYLNLSSTASSLNRYTHTCGFTLVIAEGAQAQRTALRNAVKNKTRVKATLVLTGGETEVYDRCIVGFTKAGEEDGWTMAVTLTADTWTPTEAGA